MRRPRKRTYQAMAEINITNLVDVVLVLLIIFIVPMAIAYWKSLKTSTNCLIY